MAKQTTIIEVEGRELKLSNLDKVLYPAAGFTKAQLIDYYVRIAPVLLPHLKGRPLTMKRYPEGVGGQFFYEKNCPTHRPDWVKTIPVWSEGNNRWMQYCMVGDLATLVWAANLADIELHTSLSLGTKIEQPTFLVFDLDPGTACQHRSMLPGRTLGAYIVRGDGTRGLSQDFRIEGAAGLCAAAHARHLRRDQTVCKRDCSSAGETLSGSGSFGYEKGAAHE